MLAFGILGPLEVEDDGKPVALGGPKQRATLAILLLNANRVVSVDRLADDLYSGRPPVTAVTQIQRQISGLRKTLGSASGIETRSPGYVIHVSPEHLDLTRFERVTEEAGEALSRGAAQRALELQRDALALWRGTALADVENEPFARIAIERLQEIRLVAIERRIEAELALGRHREVVAELEELVAEHLFRESVRRQLMLALYRSGRQADALDGYRSARAALVDAFGIEPGRELRELERAILNQDSALDLAGPSAPPPDRVVLVLPSSDDSVETLLRVAEPLASLPGRELILARLVADHATLEPASVMLNERRAALGVPARMAAFTTSNAADDTVRLATTYDVDLVVLDFDGADVSADLAAVLERSPADVALLSSAKNGLLDRAGVFVPFAGGAHDWSALEVASWLALAMRAPLRLVGTRADETDGRRDASRLLADASIAVQRVVGIDVEPLLADPTPDGLVAAVESASIVVVGFSPRWRQEGLGPIRCALVADARPPTLLVHSGPRPSGLAPRESRTRFTWSIEASY